MTFGTLIRRSLRFYLRAHLGVVLGAAIGSAALIGALVVGDSVRASLRATARQRLAGTSFALTAGDRFFTRDLAQHFYRPSSNQVALFEPLAWLGSAAGPVMLSLPGTASQAASGRRANHVQILGVDQDFWTFAGITNMTPIAKDSLLINQALAARLGATNGDEVLLRLQKPGHLSAEAAVTQREEGSVALRLRVREILPPERAGNFALQAGAAPPLNAFIDLEALGQATGMTNRANVLLSGPIAKVSATSPSGRGEAAATVESLAFLTETLQRNWNLADADLKLEHPSDPWEWELRSPRVFLPEPIFSAAAKVEGANATPILTYLANLLWAGTNAAPYSTVTAAGAPFTPPGLKDDEIIVSQWLADDLHIEPGDTLGMSYFLPDSGGRLAEGTNFFRVHSIAPGEGLYADRTLMPEFPGIEKAESTRDWDPSFPLVYKIRPKDEQYWKELRGTPKAFINLAAGQKMWANRFGSLTAVRLKPRPGISAAEHGGRFKDQFLANLQPAELGLTFQPVREQALRAAEQAQDFGQLFLGFSIFLVTAALLLMALLFQFGLEQRAIEVGTLLALGFRPKQVRRLLLGEAAALALLGSVLGAAGGVSYAKVMLWGLSTAWRGAVGSAALQFHATPLTLAIGIGAGTVVAIFTIWLTLRKQARRPARELLQGEEESGSIASGSKAPGRHWVDWVAIGSVLAAIATVGWALASQETANAEVFFSAGSLLLIGGLAAAAAWLRVLSQRRHSGELTLGGLGVRACARRRKRSVATMALLASGSFVILAIGVFRLDANLAATSRTSGTGGFALIGEAALPVVHDLNNRAGQEFFGLKSEDLTSVASVAFRVREGDEASCLNLNRAQKPRLLGVKPEAMAGRFTFAKELKQPGGLAGWELLRSPQAANGQKNNQVESDEVPAIGDANSIQWALGKKIGDTLDYTDENGRNFKLRLVGGVANSILQGSLIIDEAQFVKRFPGESGYRMFLIDAPSNQVSQVSATLGRALQDVGLELTPAAERLNAFNAVQNTYLGTFQILGGLGLLLGSAGLGIVVLRNVLERRGELGLLTAVGFRRRRLQRLVLSEHAALLGLGLGLGALAAAVAVLPALLSPATHLPYGSLAITLGAVMFNGLVWTWFATRYALRGNLLAALRNE